MEMYTVCSLFIAIYIDIGYLSIHKMNKYELREYCLILLRL